MVGYVSYNTTTWHLRLLRVETTGDSYEIPLGDWQSYEANNNFQSVYVSNVSLITNADQGVLASYEVDTYPNTGSMTSAFYLATTSGPSIASNSQVAMVPEQATPVQPMLQRQDGSFVGVVSSSVGNFMVAFTPSGGTLFTVPNDTPQIATSDNGVIGASGTTYDQNGNITGQTVTLTPNPSQSSGGQWPGWMANLTGSSYSAASGVAMALASAPITYATNFASLPGGNSSTQGTAIQQVQTNQAQGYSKQLPDLGLPIFCTPNGTLGGIDSIPLPLTPTCGNINAIELLTSKSPAYIFQNYLQTFAPVADVHTAKQHNSVMYFDNPADPQAAIHVTSPGQVLQITLEGFSSHLHKPFFVMTERVDTTNNVISVVTLQGHPLAGWRYWRVYSIGTNDVVVETGGYDQPGPGLKNFAGYYIAKGDISSGWQQFIQYIQAQLNAPQGSSLNGSLGGIKLSPYSSLLQGYWDYSGAFTNYILNNVCQSTSCN